MAVIGSQLYSFRYTTGVFTTVFQPDTPAAAALAAIEAKLTEGHADFLAGQYQPAIDAYHQAASLIYGQLHPQAVGGTGTISISPVPFSPMLSLGLEWMNVLAPTVPVAATRPRILADVAPADAAPADPAAAGVAPADSNQCASLLAASITRPQRRFPAPRPCGSSPRPGLSTHRRLSVSISPTGAGLLTRSWHSHLTGPSLWSLTNFPTSRGRPRNSRQSYRRPCHRDGNNALPRVSGWCCADHRSPSWADCSARAHRCAAGPRLS